MPTQNYSTVASRNLIRAEMKMLKHAENIMVLSMFGTQKEQPLNKTDSIVYRRVKPFSATSAANPASGYSETPSITAANFALSEGTTPSSNTISYTDVTTTLQQYGVLFKFTSKAALMYEDDIPDDMAKVCGDTLGEVAELVCYGAVRAGTSVIYSDGSTRGAVASKLTIGMLRKAARALEKNRATRVTSVVKAGPNFGTAPVESAYCVFIHTDCESDVRDLAGFTKRVEYGSAIKPMHDREIGACEQFRFVTSPLFTPFLAAGAAVGSTGMVADNATNIDVYPVIVMGEDAWGQCSLKGHGYTGISPTVIPAHEKNHANPSGMFGYVGADFWLSSVRLNENWMVRLECGVTAL
ncbi:MAG: N4-gp56 family major capsid protein [Planctomycetota bacterium]